MTLRLEVLTPTAGVFSGDVDQVVAPLPDGWIGILEGHAPFLARLLPGAVLFDLGSQRGRIATGGGSLSVDGESVTVLTGAALLDGDQAQLESELGRESEQFAEMETEAERQFGRVYRQLARAFRRTH